MKSLSQEDRKDIRELRDLFFEERYDMEKARMLMDVVESQWFLKLKSCVVHKEIDELFAAPEEQQEERAQKYLDEFFGKDSEFIRMEDDRLLRLITFKNKKDTWNLFIPVMENLTVENFHDYDEGKLKLMRVNSDGSQELENMAYTEKELVTGFRNSEDEDDFEETFC